MANSLSEKISYIKGLAQGLGLQQEDTKEAKILINIIGILEDIIDAIDELEISQAEQDDYIEAIDDDLTDIQDQIYGEDAEDVDDETDYIEVTCPHCQETVYFDQDMFDEEDDLVCPNCNKPIYTEDDDYEYQEEYDGDDN